MKILHVVAGIWEHTGGPAEVIPKLCEALVHENCEVTLLTIDGPHSASTIQCRQNGVNLISLPALPLLPMRYAPAMDNYIKKNIHHFDIVHNHGHWLHPNWSAFRHAKKRNIPLVTTPHGTLVPGMLARSKLKKWLAWQLFDKHLIDYASVIHALSLVEKQEMTPKIGVNSQKITIIPNGAEIWKLPEPIQLLKKFPELQQKQIILFLSRVHPIKGVIDLLETWKTTCSQYPKWHLLIVGPIEEEIKMLINNLLQDTNLKQATTLAGPIYGSVRQEAFAVADVFTLPSYGEGLPTAILEALSCKLPVICTDECNFVEAEHTGAAFSGSAGKINLLTNFKKILELSDSDRKDMGEKGQRLIKAKYSWQNIAKNWKQIYNKFI